MKVLFIGDVTGKPGVSCVGDVLPGLLRSEEPDLVVANAENAAPNGRGITGSALSALYDAGVEMITLGNHAWDQRDSYPVIEGDARVVRPANLHRSVPGAGYRICKVNGQRVAVVNLIGRTYMGLYPCPFEAADRILDELAPVARCVLVDFHAEVTSEKLAMGWHLAGRASVVLGTHTHVQTADECILPGGTAYITDVGMTGPRDGILGMKKEIVIRRFIDQMPARFEVADGPCQFCAVVVTLDDGGRATEIRRLRVT